jgi:enoyl-CoA hydratase/carnithine racemase
MSYELLTFAVADRIATITVNRPDKLNALSDATIAELGRAIDEARDRDDVAGVLLTGAGRAFVAGADIAELSSQSSAEAKRRSRRGQEVFRRFETSPKPTVAAVNGFALGGGCELAMACDVIIASETAQFGQPETNLGILPGAGGTQRLTRAIGKSKAMDVILTGRFLTAREAEAAGLVARVVAAEAWLDEAKRVAQAIAAKSQVGVRLAKEAVNQAFETSLRAGLDAERKAFHLALSSEDAQEAMQAFLEKRPPDFKGK